MALNVIIGMMHGVPYRHPSKCYCLKTLEDWCFHYVIHHLLEFPPGSLCLLPVTIRKKLLLNLPAVDIWRLEADGITEGIDQEKLWKSLIDERSQHISRNDFCLPFFHKVPSRDLYFMFVWHHALLKPPFFEKPLSRLLYNVPCVLGINELTISELNYQPSQYTLKEVIENDLRAQKVTSHQRRNPYTERALEFIPTIHYFSEVCHIRPKHFCFHCVNIGRCTWILAKTQSTSFLQSFMENLEQIRFDGCGSLDDFEDIYPHETEDERFKRLFCSIPSLFLDAAICNPHCKLKSIEIDADDGKRASSLLASIQSTLSMGYTKLEGLSLKFDSGTYLGYEYFSADTLTTHLLSDITQLINVQSYLHTIDFSIPKKFLPLKMTKTTVDRYTEFIAAIEKYAYGPHFKCLRLRNILTLEKAQQIIHTFLSLPPSFHQQLLDVRATDDTTFQPDTVLSDGSGKVLMISGTDYDGEESLTSLVFQMLCDASVYHFGVVDSIDGIISALKHPIENLNVKKIDLTIRKVSVPSSTWLQYRSLWPKLVTRHFSSFQSGSINRKLCKNVEVFQRIDKLIGNPSLLALRIKFQSAEDYLSSFQVSSFLSTVSDGLQLQSCSLRSLTLPKLDYPVENDDDLKHFFCCLFSLSHTEELEINLAFVKFSLQLAEMIHSCYCECGGKKLAKFNLHCDSIVGHYSEEPLKVLLNNICKELILSRVS